MTTLRASFATLGSLGILVMLSLPAWAEEAASHESPVPQFNPESFPGQLFWLTITFVLLYWAMNSWVLPKIGRVIEARDSSITEDIAAAHKKRDEAARLIATYDSEMATARATAQKLIADTQAEAARQATEALTAQGRQLSESARLTDTRIRAAVSAAEANLLPVACTTTAAAVKQLTGLTPSDELVDSAVRTALQKRREIMDAA